MKSILDPSFRYTASFNTNLQRTFARIRRDQKLEAKGPALRATGALAKVSPLVRKTATGRS